MSRFPVPAVVIGLCSHGLAVVRALAREGVQVHALESNLRLPGASTRHAWVHSTPDINGPGLLEDLVGLALKLDSEYSPVLFLINDNMVRTVSAGWGLLREHYSMSWATSRSAVDKLIMKDSLAAYCQERGFPHPKTVRLSKLEQTDEVGRDLGFPMIVKPCKPMSAFKVKIVETAEDLRTVCLELASELPFVAQQLISGGDRNIFFCNVFLDNGSVISHFEGRKLRTTPPTLGGATAATHSSEEWLLELTRDFFAPLNFTGPASLEVKCDPEGQPWVIEATVGRTDYYVHLCVRGGVNLPFVEYCHQLGLRVRDAKAVRRSLWIDVERDWPAALRVVPWWIEAGLRTRVGFSYFAADDPLPFAHASMQSARRHLGHLGMRLGKRLSRRPAIL